MKISGITAEDHDEVARLLHHSLVSWYQKNLGQGERFGFNHEPFLLYPRVYEMLDPGECLAARDESSGAILGVCFVHPRETHYAVGIVASDPDTNQRGVAKALMQKVIDKATAEGKPVRLVSSLFNLDSFSLYTRMGFVPRTVFQDMQIQIPESGLAVAAPEGVERVRLAHKDEAVRLADFEREWQGIRREKDLRYILQNTQDWEVWVMESERGEVEGFIASSLDPSFSMLGPGVAGTESAAAALLWKALDNLRGQSFVFLIPSARSGLVKTLYSWGCRNVELHVAQCYGDSPEGSGISFPSFLPESA